MNILVTGGAGFIGSQCTIDLIKRGHNVRVLDNFRRGKTSRLRHYSKDCEFVNGDIRNLNTVKKCLKKIDVVYHLAYINGTKNFYSHPYEIMEVGIKGIYNIFDCFKKKPIEHFILASSSEVYQSADIIPTPEEIEHKIPDVKNPRFSYGGGKIISELVAIHSMPKLFNKLTIFRPHNVYGPNMGFDHVIPELILKIKKIASKKILTIQGSGNETRSFIYIDDLISSLNLSVKNTKHIDIYHLGTSEEIKIKHLAKKILQLTKNNSIKINPSAKTTGSTNRRCPDISKIKKIGFKQKVSLDEGLLKTIDWYYKNTSLS